MSNELITITLTEHEWFLIVDAAEEGTAHINKPNEVTRAVDNLDKHIAKGQQNV